LPGELERRRPPSSWRISGPQRAAALLLAAASVVGLRWYLPRVIAADASELTGAVTSNGVVDLNFAGTGQVGRVLVSPGQPVRKGQVLATEVAPAALAVVAANAAAITADRAQLAALRSTGAISAQIAAARAQLDKDVAQLAVGRAALAQTRIIAPANGSVLALNAQPGEIVSAVGVRAYSQSSQSVPVTQQPLFSLLPEGPQASIKVTGSAADAALPVIELKTAGSWQVVVLVSEQSVGGVRLGEHVAVSVPAVAINAMPGRISEVLTTPVPTAQGVAYQVIVSVNGRPGPSPLDGMTANVRLSR
jgi:multidrug efflux pump subunit AcrA (membrane-fusion protein)